VVESTVDTPKSEKKITMYATTWCGDCRFARRWLDAHGIAYDYINIEENEQAATYVAQVNNGARSVPTLIFPDGSVLVEPDARQLVTKFQLNERRV
jgi:mycoredoxin